MSDNNNKAFNLSSPALPHFAGLSWRLDVPMASRASASQPKGEGKALPVYSLRLSLASMEPNAFSATTAEKSVDEDQSTTTTSKSSQKEENGEKVTSVTAKIEEVSFSCTPETLLALAESVEAAVKQSEQAPYRRILRLIR